MGESPHKAYFPLVKMLNEVCTLYFINSVNDIFNTYEISCSTSSLDNDTFRQLSFPQFFIRLGCFIPNGPGTGLR